MDGKKLGPAPLHLESLPPGSVQVMVKKPRCESVVEKVELKAGVTRQVNAALKCP